MDMPSNKTTTMREVKNTRELNIRVTPAPPYKPSTMSTEHRLFLRALQGLRDDEAIRLYCDDSEDASLLAKAIDTFIRQMRKTGRLNHRFSVLKRQEGENLVIYAIKGGSQKGK